MPAAEPTRGDPPVRARPPPAPALRDVLRSLTDALKPHQRESVQFVLAQPASILGNVPGVGKTAQAIAVIAVVFGGGFDGVAAATQVLVVELATVVLNPRH